MCSMKTPIVLVIVLATVVIAKPAVPKKCKAAEEAADPRKCAALCALQAEKAMDEKGEIIFANVPPENTPIATKCAAKNRQQNLCERGAAFNKCFQKAQVNDLTKKCKAAAKATDPRKCADLCALQAEEAMDEKGEIIFGNIPLQNTQIATKCAAKNRQQNICERGAAFKKCFQEAQVIAFTKKCKAAAGATDPSKCVALCALQAEKAMDEKGEIIFANIPPLNTPMATKCAAKNRQQNLCERGTAFNNCFQKEKNEATIISLCSIARGATDPKKCLKVCAMQLTGKVNKRAEVILTKIPANMRPIASKCDAKNRQTDLCERGAAFVQCFNDEAKLPQNDISNQCAKETNTVVDASKALLATTLFDVYKACYHRCMLIKSGYMNDQNEVVVAKLSATNGIAVVSKCHKENTQDSQCLQAIRRMSCVWEELAKTRKN